MSEINSKICKSCKTDKPLTEYRQDNRSKNYPSTCKTCNNLRYLIPKELRVAKPGNKICQDCKIEKSINEFQFYDKINLYADFCNECCGPIELQTEELKIKKRGKSQTYRTANGKVCGTCKQFKNYNEFGPYKKSPDGKRSECFNCRKDDYYDNHDKMLEQKRVDYEKHKESRLEYSKIYYNENSETIKQNSNNYYHENKHTEHHKIVRQTYRSKPETKARRNKQHHERMKIDPNYVIERRLRSRFNDTVKKRDISATIIGLLGCSLEEFFKHIENHFTEGMSWGKIMNAEIALDHIVPCCAFDFRIKEEREACFHYSNIQPLWDKDNSIKASRDKKLSIRNHLSMQNFPTQEEIQELEIINPEIADFI